MAVSSLIFGTNLALFSNQDQVLTSQQAQNCLQQMHISIIRVPSRSGVDVATITQAAQMVQQLGATPLIVLHGSLDANAYSDDIAVIQAMNSIFGTSTIYYEYGNNEDLAQVSAKKYTDSWNANVPGLKKLATNGLFIGPVTYQFRPEYLHYFLQKAAPQPDAISWHEYTCNSTDSNSTCTDNIKYWKSHVQNARRLMKSVIHTTLPIMITEWNYAPTATQNDGKNNNSVFMTTWTSQAIQALADSGVFASIQYAATNTNINLIDSTNALTVQGSIMQSEYETLVPSSSSSGTSSSTPTPTPTDTATTTVTPTDTPVSDASAAATPSTPTIAPSSSVVSQSE
jgi:hypothetical protein